MDKRKKIESIYIDDEMLNDPKMDRLLRKDMMEEADRIERELNEDPSLQGIKASDDMFDLIKARLQEQGVWEENEEQEEQKEQKEQKKTESIVSAEGQEEHKTAENNMEENAAGAGGETIESVVEDIADCGNAADEVQTEKDVYSFLSKEDREALELGRKIKKKRKRNWKGLVAVATVALVVFSAGMSGEASRRWILEAWDRITLAVGVRMSTDYVEEGQDNVLKYSKEEQNAWKKIKEELDIPIVDFGYLPQEMELIDYNILKDTNEVLLIYVCENKMFNLRIISGNKGASFYLQSDVEPILKEKIINDLEIPIEIWDTSTKGVESYRAIFQYKECTFICSGAISYDEFKKIIKYIEII